MDDEDGSLRIDAHYSAWNTAAWDVATAFGCTDWGDYLSALDDDTRRAQLQALATSWKEE